MKILLKDDYNPYTHGDISVYVKDETPEDSIIEMGESGIHCVLTTSGNDILLSPNIVNILKKYPNIQIANCMDSRRLQTKNVAKKIINQECSTPFGTPGSVLPDIMPVPISFYADNCVPDTTKKSKEDIPVQIPTPHVFVSRSQSSSFSKDRRKVTTDEHPYGNHSSIYWGEQKTIGIVERDDLTFELTDALNAFYRNPYDPKTLDDFIHELDILVHSPRNLIVPWQIDSQKGNIGSLAGNKMTRRKLLTAINKEGYGDAFIRVDDNVLEAFKRDAIKAHHPLRRIDKYVGNQDQLLWEIETSALRPANPREWWYSTFFCGADYKAALGRERSMMEGGAPTLDVFDEKGNKKRIRIKGNSALLKLGRYALEAFKTGVLLRTFLEDDPASDHLPLLKRAKEIAKQRDW